MTPKNTICLWFDKDALEAARFYAATFPDSKVTPWDSWNRRGKAIAKSLELHSATLTLISGRTLHS